MPYKLIYLPGFVEDYWDVLHYITHDLHAPQAAQHLLAQAEQSMQRLAEFPHQGKRVYRSNGEPTEYRRLNVKNYAIFYCVNETEHIIEVRRFLYSRRNLEALLK